MPVVLAASLVLGILTCGASAYVNMGSEITLDDLLDSRNCPSDLRPLIMSNLEQYSDASEFLILVSCYLEGVSLNYTQFQIIRLLDQDGNPIPDLEISFTWNNPTNVELSFNQSLLVSQWRWIYGGATVSYNDGSAYVRSTGFTGNNNQYINSTIYLSPYQNQPSNLVVDYMFDSRVFDVWKSVDYPESSNPLEYINVRVDDGTDLDKISSQKIRFDYIDQDGNHLYKVFTESDFHDIRHVDDCFEFYIFPYLISSYEFTITQSTYYPDLVEWGSKTIELDLTFNEDVIYPLPSGWNDSYYITQYFNSNSNGRLSYGTSNIGYKVVGIYTYWTDEYLVCWQNFDVKGLFVPDFLTSDFQNNLDMQEVYSLFEQYDVIFTDCIETEIDGICGQYVYDNTNYVFLHEGFIPALRFLISQGIIQQHRSLPLSVDSSSLSYYDNVANGFIVTRSFLLKRMLAALGDVDDRLLEFESNLFDEDGLGVSLQNKLDNLLSQQNTFFSDVSRFFQKLEYGLNGASLSNIEKWIKDIRNSLVGEFHFDFEALEHPWLDIYEFVKSLFDNSLNYLSDFSESTSAMLDGSEYTSLPVPDMTVVPALPFNPSPTPTYIPIPTLGG